MKRLIVLLLLAFGLPLFAQKVSIINDPNAVLRTLKGSFSAISVSDGVQLYLTQGNEESIAVSTSDAKYEERFKAEVINGVLKIWYNNQGINWTGNEKRKLKAYVSYKNLEKLTATGGASVIMKSILTAEKMECSFTSGSRFSGEVAINQLDIAENSGASIEINGKADHLKVDVSSGAMFKGYDLTTEYCEVRASSGGGARIKVNKELLVKANSGGAVHYKGDGVIKDMNVNSGGIVKKG